MRIAIDCRVLTSPVDTGIQVYTRRLVEHLAALDRDNRYYVLFAGLRHRNQNGRLTLPRNFRSVVLPVPDRATRGETFVWNRIALPVFFCARGIDVYHLPVSQHLLRSGKAKRVITIHDLRGAHVHEDSFAQDLEMLHRSCQLADLVLTVSEFTRKDIVQLFDVPAAKVKTAYPGVDGDFRAPVSELQRTACRKRLGMDRPFFLTVGLALRKNVERLVSAYAASGLSERFSLVVAGYGDRPHLDRYRALIRAHGLERHVVLPGYVPPGELALWYRAAHAFVFPSLWEGFGLPVLEAMACGTPVITSTVSSLPEVAGDAAILVDPHDPGAIARAMATIAEDERLRAALRQRGRERAASFTWANMAAQVLEAYASL